MYRGDNIRRHGVTVRKRPQFTLPLIKGDLTCAFFRSRDRFKSLKNKKLVGFFSDAEFHIEIGNLDCESFSLQFTPSSFTDIPEEWLQVSEELIIYFINVRTKISISSIIYKGKIFDRTSVCASLAF